MEINRSIRYRINVSRTSTGRISWDTTVDMEGFKMGEVLWESDRLVEELNKRYPFLEIKEE